MTPFPKNSLILFYSALIFAQLRYVRLGVVFTPCTWYISVVDATVQLFLLNNKVWSCTYGTSTFGVWYVRKYLSVVLFYLRVNAGKGAHFDTPSFKKTKLGLGNYRHDNPSFFVFFSFRPWVHSAGLFLLLARKRREDLQFPHCSS